MPVDRPSDVTVPAARPALPDDTSVEPGGPEPAAFAAAGLRLLLCRLSTYDQVLPSITHRALLWAARGVPGVYADVAYRPPEDGQPQREGRPPAGWVAAGCGEPEIIQPGPARVA